MKSGIANGAWLDRHSDAVALVLPSHYGFRHMANHSTMQTTVGKRDLARPTSDNTMNTEHFYRLDRPFHLAPGPSQVKVANLGSFPELVSRWGADPIRLLERYEIDPDTIEDRENFIECRAMVDLLEHCASQYDQPLFGLHLAELQEPAMYGVVAALCGAARDLREGLRCFVDYIPVIHSSESVLELVAGEHLSELRWSERSDMGRNVQASLQGLLMNMKMLRALGGRSFVPNHVQVPGHWSERSLGEVERIMACPVRTRSPQFSIVFATQALSLPIPSANRPLFQLLESYLAQLKSRAPHRDILDEVNDFVRGRLGCSEISIDACARTLSISARTLQLRLRERGTSYSVIVDQQRLARAENFLVGTDLSVSDISDRLGYAERTSFGRAFKRWTGMSPEQFRRRGRAGT